MVILRVQKYIKNYLENVFFYEYLYFTYVLSKDMALYVQVSRDGVKKIRTHWCDKCVLLFKMYVTGFSELDM